MKRFIALALTVVMLACLFPLSVFAEEVTSGSCGDSLVWSYENGVLTIKGTGAMDYNYDQAPWRHLDSSITKIVMEEGVTLIKNNAFDDMENLTEFNIPDSVTEIGDYAFNSCTSITSVTIGVNVKTLGIAVFKNCSKLTEINFNAKNVTLSDGEYYGTFSTIGTETAGVTVNFGTEIQTVPAGIFNAAPKVNVVNYLGDKVEVIGQAAFSGTSIETMNLPNTVVTLEKNAFSDCTKLKTIHIDSNIKEIGNGVFNGCSNVTTVNYNTKKIEEFCDPWYGAVMGDVGSETDGVTVNVGENVEIIPARFMLGANVAEINFLGSKVETIGYDAFKECASLTEVVIPEGVVTVGNYAFNDCDKLISVTIPESVTTLGDAAFKNCDNLAEINYNAKNPTIKTGEYYGTFSTIGDKADGITVNFGENVTIVPEHIFSSTPKVTNVNFLGNKVETIGDNAFANTEIASIVIPESVTRIESSAFSGCERLTEFTFPEGIKELGYGVLNGCKRLEVINYNTKDATAYYDSWNGPDVIVDVGSFTDDGITVNFGENVKVVPDSLLQEAGDIKAVVFQGSALETIENNAFGNEDHITDISFAGSENKWNKVEINDGNGALLFPTIIFGEEDTFMLGDINENGKIDMTDYILLKRAYFGTYTFTDNQKKAGDINANEKIDMTDYILLKRVYFGTYTIK